MDPSDKTPVTLPNGEKRESGKEANRERGKDPIYVRDSFEETFLVSPAPCYLFSTTIPGRDVRRGHGRKQTLSPF
jgi:hypothetical protein